MRTDIATRVITSTRVVLWRMWCAGEIATAVANNVRIVIVRCDDYMHPDEAYLNVLETAWSEEEVHTLASFGLFLPRIKDAYRQLRSRSAVAYLRFGSSTTQELAIRNLAELCGAPLREMGSCKPTQSGSQ